MTTYRQTIAEAFQTIPSALSDIQVLSPSWLPVRLWRMKWILLIPICSMILYSFILPSCIYMVQNFICASGSYDKLKTGVTMLLLLLQIGIIRGISLIIYSLIFHLVPSLQSNVIFLNMIIIIGSMTDLLCLEFLHCCE